MSEWRQWTWPRRLAMIAGLLLVFGLYVWALQALFTSRFPGANDFYARYVPMRAWLLEGRSPYAPDVTLETQVGMYGRPARPDDDQGLFSYPLHSAVFFALPSLIPDYAWASAVWLALLQAALLALIGSSLAWSRWQPPAWLRLTTLVFSLLWYHNARTLILGQFAGIEALLLVGALLALRAGRDAWAGALLALATVKPHMAVLLIPALLAWCVWQRRWAMPLWFGLLTGALIAAFGWLLPSWPWEWAAQLNAYVYQAFIPGPIAILVNYAWPGGQPLVEAALSLLLLGLTAWAWWQAIFPGNFVWLARAAGGPRFEWAAALTLVTTNLVLVRTATTNYLMMLPALFLVFRELQARWTRRGVWAIAGLQAALFAGLWLLFALTVRGDAEQALMFLPLPLLLLAGLLWLRPARAESA